MQSIIQTELQDRLGDLDDQLHMLREMVADDIEELKQCMSFTGLGKGVHTVSDKDLVHIVRVGLPASPTKWATRCGFRFGGGLFFTSCSRLHP